jgi:hypothetical protein
MTAFNFYYFLEEGDKTLYCTVNNDKEVRKDKNVMEYYPQQKWIVLKDFMPSKAGIKDKEGKNARIRGVRILGIRIEDYILNKIIWNFYYNTPDSEYTYPNYLNYIESIKNKRGFLVRVCEFEKQCGSAMIVSTVKGTKIQHYNIFLAVKKALNLKPRNKKPLIYQLTDKYYFIALRTEKKFVCYKCMTGKYYRNSQLYDLQRYGWERLDKE